MKNELRGEMRQRLKASGADSPKAAIWLPEDTKTVFAYLPHGQEIDIGPLISFALARGKTVAVPRVTGDSMSFHRIDSAEGPFETGAFGIREPRASTIRLFPSSGGKITFPVLILVPGLAFDLTGRRLGRGAGYYDRFLSFFLATFPGRRDEIRIAGVCHSFQIVDEVPTDTHDIPVDWLLTEKGCILCMKNGGDNG